MKKKNILFIAMVLPFAFAVYAMAEANATQKSKAVTAVAVERDENERSLVEKEVFEKASQYALSISCDPELDSKKLVVLIPRDDDHDIWDVRYALIWRGDIRCWGGSGSSQPQITIVGVGAGGSIVVLPELSSPMVEFNPSVRIINKITKATENELTLEGMDWSTSDALCCPTTPVQIVMRRDEKNNWKLIEKKQATKDSEHTSQPTR